MSTYWMGVLSVPAFVLGAAAAWLSAKAVAKVGEHLLVGGVMRIKGETTSGQRVGMASVIYSAKRAWFVAPGNLGLVFIVGMDRDEMRKASALLNPPVKINVRAFGATAGDDL